VYSNSLNIQDSGTGIGSSRIYVLYGPVAAVEPNRTTPLHEKSNIYATDQP